MHWLKSRLRKVQTGDRPVFYVRRRKTLGDLLVNHELGRRVLVRTKAFFSFFLTLFFSNIRQGLIRFAIEESHFKKVYFKLPSFLLAVLMSIASGLHDLVHL